MVNRSPYLKKKCLVDECGDSNYGKGYCRKHYYRLYRTGSLEGKKKPNGAGYKDKNGYIVKQVNKKRYLEHRLIMEEHLGRKLTKTETVHHLNGVRDDNRIENLELWDSAHPYGQRKEDKIQWCIKYLEENGYEVQEKPSSPK